MSNIILYWSLFAVAANCFISMKYVQVVKTPDSHYMINARHEIEWMKNRWLYINSRDQLWVPLSMVAAASSSFNWKKATLPPIDINIVLSRKRTQALFLMILVLLFNTIILFCLTFIQYTGHKPAPVIDPMNSPSPYLLLTVFLSMHTTFSDLYGAHTHTTFLSIM